MIYILHAISHFFFFFFFFFFWLKNQTFIRISREACIVDGEFEEVDI